MQAFEWTKLIIHEGVRPWGNPMGAPQFGSSFFMITGFHGLHVSAGVVYLSVVARRVWTGFYDRKGTYETVEITGLYWHFGASTWRSFLDAAAAAEAAAHVVQHLVGLHVGMGVGHLDRLGMRVEQARGKGADDEAGRVEGLLHRRRLMDRAGDRLEVVGVEGVGIDHAVPADHVEGMVRQRVARQPRAVLDEHGGFLLLIDDQRLARAVQIALGIRRSQAELAVAD